MRVTTKISEYIGRWAHMMMVWTRSHNIRVRETEMTGTLEMLYPGQ
jgi:hypothetical protein